MTLNKPQHDNKLVKDEYFKRLADGGVRLGGEVRMPRDLEDFIEGFYNVSADLMRARQLDWDYEPPGDRTISDYRAEFKKLYPSVLPKTVRVEDHVEVTQRRPRKIDRPNWLL